MNYGIYHGCHNSFVIGYDVPNLNYSIEAKRLCKLHGTDGYIILRENPLEMLYFNSDGTRAPMCGNGVRCYSRYGYDIGVIKDRQFTVSTLGGELELEITNLDPFLVKVNLGKPNFSSKLLGIDTNKNEFLNEVIRVGDKELTVNAVFMNTHHLVIFVDEFDELLSLADEIHRHSKFTDKINVNFVIVRNNHKIEIRTFERGVGWTLACGTGAASAFVIGKRFGYIEDFADVESIGGVLRITNLAEQIIMEGPVVTVKEPQYGSTT